MEVILSDFKNHPHCPHGPCLLFERYSAHGTKTGRKFFACSACRDRSECSFFHWEDEEMSEKVKEVWKKIISKTKPPYTHAEYAQRLVAFKKQPVPQRRYCKTCSTLITDDVTKHSSHDVITGITDDNLVHPSLLFKVHENKKVEAQYFFSNSTVSFLVSLLQNLGFTKVICIGAPRIHEYIVSGKVKHMQSILLDLDSRYMQFYSPDQFFHYNMFNNHFFEGESRVNDLKSVLRECPNEKTVTIIDPPFGGLIDALSLSLKTLNQWWQKENETADKQMAILWIFPYFHEHRILKSLPDMKMMDYRVEYENHKKFRKNSMKMSPVRIFTNIPASSFVLPKGDGYRFCKKCKRYVAAENKHCPKCDACTTKHGKTYHHCDECKECVKSSYMHCNGCNKCGPAAETSGVCKNCKCGNAEDSQNGLERCFNCSGVGHRKRTCPEGMMRHLKRRKVRKIVK